MDKKVEEELEDIARSCFGIEVWNDRGLDQLDFYDVSISSIRKALKQAYIVGYENTKKV